MVEKQFEKILTFTHIDRDANSDVNILIFTQQNTKFKEWSMPKVIQNVRKWKSSCTGEESINSNRHFGEQSGST